MEARRPPQPTIATLLATLQRGFDATATWVTQLSWWKFFLFAALALIAASILQDELFSGAPELVEVRSERKAGKAGKRDKSEGNIVFDDSGIRYSPAKKKGGLPEDSTALTVNRLCGSGMQAIVSASQMIMLGDVDAAVGGGAVSSICRT